MSIKNLFLQKNTGKAQRLITAFFIALIPLLAVIVSTLADGKFLWDIYTPASEWNDELFYYKMTEGVLSNGIPGGYFGFNESSAQIFSFAAWSPVILLPWIIWGRIFGWNLISPVICNVVMMMIACFIYGYLTRPNILSTIILGSSYLCFGFFARFSLSATPENVFFAGMIMYIAFLTRILRGKNKPVSEDEKALQKEISKQKASLSFTIVITVFLTLMRPYFICLFILPLYILIKGFKNGEKNTINKLGAVFTMLFTLAAYYLIGHYFCAEYFEELYYLDWLKSFGEGLGVGLTSMIERLERSYLTFKNLCVEALRGGHSYGAQYMCFLVVSSIQFICFLVSIVKYRRQGNKECLISLQLQLLVFNILFLIADFLMYRIPEGGRHTMVMVAGGIFIFGVVNTEFNKIFEGILGIASMASLFYMTVLGAKNTDPYLFANPYNVPELEASIEELKAGFAKNNVTLEGETPSWDNTIIWMFFDHDLSDPDTLVSQRWQLYYAVPEGMGINLCNYDHVSVHFDELRSRYIGTSANSETDQRCREAGFEKVAENKDIIIYRRY